MDMEEKQTRNIKSRKKIQQTMSTSSIMSALGLAIVAVMAVVVFGFNSSYAAEDVGTVLPDQFTTAEVTKTIHGDTNFKISPYHTTDGQQVFCLEHMVDFKSGATFTKGDAITDYGLLYLMANIYPNVQFDAFLNADLQTWLSQTAVWMYLYEKELIDYGSVAETSKNYISPTDLEYIKTTRGITIDDDFTVVYTGNPNTGGISNVSVTTDDPILYDKYIKPVVDAALQNRAQAATKKLYINFDDEISITQDNKYYQTSAVSVTATPADSFRGYEVVINSAPEGTFVVDANGNKIEDLKNMSPTDKFYFRIPVDKMTDANKILKFSINGTFKIYSGNYYVSENAQTITSVNLQDTVLSDGAELPLNYSPRVPDTGMSTAQTVYFIGLIILLSGVGIIYANVKPEESN